jgi:hypothetical protein
VTPNIVAIAGVPVRAADKGRLISCTGEGMGSLEAQATAFSWLAAGFFLGGAILGYYLERTRRA